MSLAATASMATWSAEASMTSTGTGSIVRGPGPLPRERPIHDREQTRVDLLLDGKQIDKRLVNPCVGVVPAGVEETTERVLHCAGRGRVRMGTSIVSESHVR